MLSYLKITQMRILCENRVVERNRCYHLVGRLAHRAFFLDDEEKDRAVALMRRVEEGVLLYQ